MQPVAHAEDAVQMFSSAAAHGSQKTVFTGEIDFFFFNFITNVVAVRYTVGVQDTNTLKRVKGH